MKFDVDIAIFGAGAAGITAAKTAVGFGKKVALIEPNKIGGECTWTGCVPSKSLIKSAEIAYHIKQAQKWGIKTESSFGAEDVFTYIKSRIAEVYEHTKPEDFAKLGINMIMQPAWFVDKHTIACKDGATFTAKKIIICTGSRPFVPLIEGLDTVHYMTNDTFFDQKKLPKSLLILGGGPIGAEMASACNRLGVQVTIIEMQDRILPREDDELVAMLTEHLKHEGVSIQTQAKAIKVKQQDGLIHLDCLDNNGNMQTYKAESLLIAVGRRPNVEGLGLETIGIETDRHGIKTNAYMQTNIKHIYACGDVVGPYLFSHMAWQQAVVATRNACIPFFKKNIDYQNVIWATFTAPEIASGGLTQKEAYETFGEKNVKLYTYPYHKLDRAITDNEMVGLIKIICYKGRIIGIHALGNHAADIVHEAQLAKWYHIPLRSIQPVIHAYPTYAELVWQVSKRAYLDHILANPFIRFIRLFVKK